MTDSLETIFSRQRDLQVSAFGVDPGALTLEERVEYIDWNLTAMVQEIAEARDEIAWKNWAADYKQFVNAPGLIGEMVDVLHFFVNVMLAVGATPQELVDAYVKKRKVNADRQAAGYEHTTQKCESCGRALDEPHAS